jgi:hypothetical protein
LIFHPFLASYIVELIFKIFYRSHFGSSYSCSSRIEVFKAQLLLDGLMTTGGNSLPSSRAAARVAADALIRKMALRLDALEEQLSVVTKQRDALLACGDTSCREAAIIAAFRLHSAACLSSGIDNHWANQAILGSGWSSASSRAILEKGAAARHLRLATLPDA